MPNGKPGDAPWSDFFVHGREIFPPDMAAMLRAIHAVDPDDGRAKLVQIMANNHITVD